MTRHPSLARGKSKLATELERAPTQLSLNPPPSSVPPTRNHSTPSGIRRNSLTPIKQLELAIGSILFCVNAIEDPVQKALTHAVDSGQRLGNPKMAPKAKAIFHRIFGETFSVIEMLKEHLAPILDQIKSLEGKTPDSNMLRSLVGSVSDAIPMLRSGFKALDHTSHEEAVSAEIQKEKRFISQVEDFLKSKGGQSPAARGKLQQAVQLASVYIATLSKLADPEYADRIAINVERATKEHIPAVISAAKALSESLGATQKAASVRKSQKRMQQVTKRIVLLAYLRSKSQ